jgi:hypothetical protein
VEKKGVQVMTNIIFTPAFDVLTEYSPQPASRHVPDWYKTMESYIGEIKKPSGEGQTSATIKRCMPVFDAITGGYIIPTYVDIFVTQVPALDPNNFGLQETAPWYEWPSMKPIQFHPIEQAPKHPARKELSEDAGYPKWNNPWGIKTPPGYSCLFVPPFHRDSLFTILPGIVDTDSYNAPVNFPFALNDWKFEGLIPAGTPMVQVIPFKRDSWQMSIGNEEDIKEQEHINKTLRSRFFDVYKNTYRHTKEFK